MPRASEARTRRPPPAPAESPGQQDKSALAHSETHKTMGLTCSAHTLLDDPERATPEAPSHQRLSPAP